MLKEGPRPSRSRGNKEGEVVPAHRLFERPHYAGGVVERAYPEKRLTVVTRRRRRLARTTVRDGRRPSRIQRPTRSRGRARNRRPTRRGAIEELKVDRSFVDGLDHEAEDTAIVTSIVKRAGAVDVHVVAEGVESWSAWSRGAVDSQFPW